MNFQSSSVPAIFLNVWALMFPLLHSAPCDHLWNILDHFKLVNTSSIRDQL